MTTPEIEYRPNPKKPPSPRLIIATCLELLMFAEFLANKLWFGIILCVLYAWFSASRAMVDYLLDDEES